MGKESKETIEKNYNIFLKEINNLHKVHNFKNFDSKVNEGYEYFYDFEGYENLILSNIKIEVDKLIYKNPNLELEIKELVSKTYFKGRFFEFVNNKNK